MRKILKNLMSFTSLSNLVIHCADGRLMKHIYQWLKSQKIAGHCDELSFAGGCKDLVAPKHEADREYLLRQIGILRELHGTQRVFLMNHTDCGAYGGKNAFENEAQEIQKHAGDLRETASLIKSRWPDMEVRMMVIIIEGDEIKDFKEIK